MDERNLQFDLASQEDNTPLEDDENIKQEMQLSSNQILVSKIYKLHWREDVVAAATDVIVPVEVSKITAVDKSSKHCFYFMLRHNGAWRKEEADEPTDGRIRGHLNQVDAFAIILERNDNDDTDSKVEKMTIGPEGGKFISKKDDRITMDFPRGALDQSVDFQFKAAMVDKERYDEYMKLSSDFSCIKGFTHTLGVSPEVALNRPVQVCLPLDADTGRYNTDVLFLHWKKDGKGRKVAHITDKHPSAEHNNSYSTSVCASTSSAYAPVCVAKSTPVETVESSAEYLCGRKSLCNILTFINYDKKHKLHRMLLDCVDFYKVDSVIELHKQDGMGEVEKSRSRDIEMKKKTRIKLSLEGNLTFFDKNIRVNSLLYDRHARTNKVIIPVTSTGGTSLSVVRYSWDRDIHQVFFFLDREKEKGSFKSHLEIESTGHVTPGYHLDKRSDKRTNRTKLKTILNMKNGRMEDSHTGKLEQSRRLAQLRLPSGSGSKLNTTDLKRNAETSTINKTDGKKFNKAAEVLYQRDLSCQTNTNSVNGHQRTYEEGHVELLVSPMLTDRSLSALSDSLPLCTWKSIGFELNFTNDHMDTIFERSERKKSDPRFDLLREWRIHGSSADSGTLILQLMSALEEIGRNDIVEILKMVQKQHREVRRSDFGRSPAPAGDDSVRSNKKRPGEFIYPDNI